MPTMYYVKGIWNPNVKDPIFLRFWRYTDEVAWEGFHSSQSLPISWVICGFSWSFVSKFRQRGCGIRNHYSSPQLRRSHWTYGSWVHGNAAFYWVSLQPLSFPFQVWLSLHQKLLFSWNPNSVLELSIRYSLNEAQALIIRRTGK
jgi:hypothetical protein